MAVFYRVLPAGAAVGAFAILATLYMSGRQDLYVRVLTGWGVEPFRFPFLDTSGALAAWDCTRLGIDVIVHDPCDLLDRSYNVSVRRRPRISYACGLMVCGSTFWRGCARPE